MPHIDPTARVGDQVHIDDDATIGPFCVLEGDVRIGAGTHLVGNVYVRGPVTIGSNNTIYPFTCIGFAPQDFKWDPDRAGAGVVIGDDNLFREHVTIHRATKDDVPTRIGNANLFMATSHAGHDSHVGDRCIFGNQVALAGHVRVDDQVNIGGLAAVAQHLAVGRLAFAGGVTPHKVNIPPFMMSRVGGSVMGVNVIGMRRAGFERGEIDQARWAYRVMYQRRLARQGILDALAERADESDAVNTIATFVASCKGSIGKPDRRTED